MRPWVDERLIKPAGAVLSEIPVARELLDIGTLPAASLEQGIEWMFISHVDERYSAWPHWSTTDGLTLFLCRRPAEDVLEVVGLCYLDFTDKTFPLRARVELSEDRADLKTYSADIGEADAAGAPPRLREGSIIAAGRDDDGNPEPCLVVRRHEQAIQWVHAFTVTRDDLD